MIEFMQRSQDSLSAVEIQKERIARLREKLRDAMRALQQEQDALFRGVGKQSAYKEKLEKYQGALRMVEHEERYLAHLVEVEKTSDLD